MSCVSLCCEWKEVKALVRVQFSIVEKGKHNLLVLMHIYEIAERDTN